MNKPLNISHLDIIDYRKKNGITQGEFAKMIGTSPRTVQNYESGGKIPNSKQAILRELLKTDKILPPKPEDDYIAIPDTSGGGNFNRFTTLPNGQYLMTMPLLNTEAQAGYLDAYDDANYLTDLPLHTVIVDEIQEGNYIAWSVRGDSMDNNDSHSIKHGSILTTREFDKSNWKNSLPIRKHPYWVIIHKDGVLFKQIKKHDVDNGIITCHSLNTSPEFKDFDLQLSEVLQLCCVIQYTTTVGN